MKVYINETIYKTMFSYCLKCIKNIESKNPKAVRTQSKNVMLLYQIM